MTATRPDTSKLPQPKRIGLDYAEISLSGPQVSVRDCSLGISASADKGADLQVEYSNHQPVRHRLWRKASESRYQIRVRFLPKDTASPQATGLICLADDCMAQGL